MAAKEALPEPGQQFFLERTLLAQQLAFIVLHPHMRHPMPHTVAVYELAGQGFVRLIVLVHHKEQFVGLADFLVHLAGIITDMKQFIILGASSVYGVGAENGGWGDLVKQYVHSKMYGAGGVGEKYEVFNFSKAGSTIEFVADTAPWIYQNYARSEDVMTLISVGGNDARAVDAPDNFICTPEDFRTKVTDLFEMLQKHSKHIVFVRNNYVDEAKTNPKSNPLKPGHVSYFTNERRFLFNDITKEVCASKGLAFIAPDVDKETWIQNYVWDDGLHPNQAGYQKILEALQPEVDKYLAD